MIDLKTSVNRLRGAVAIGMTTALFVTGCDKPSGNNSRAASAATTSESKENAMNSNLSYKDISVRDLESYRGKARFIDVREPNEFTGDLGHIAGAELVPLGTVSGTASSWKTDEPLVIICRSGGRSGRAAAALVEAGFTNVMNMAGGMLAYQAAGLPTER